MWSSLFSTNREVIEELCDRCQRFDIQTFRKDGYPYRGYLLTDALRSAIGGCSFCALLIDHLSANDDGKVSTYLAVAYRRETGEKVVTSRLGQLNLLRLRIMSLLTPVWVHFTAIVDENQDCVQCKETGALNITGIRAFVSPFMAARDTIDAGNSWTREINVHFAADYATPASNSHDIVGQLSVDIYKWSPQSIHAIKVWQATCANNHRDCCKTLSHCKSVDVENAPLPARCIELELIDHGRYVNWHLRETEGWRGKYITLSHHWTPQTEKANTLRKNYACRTSQCQHSHRRKSPWNHITATFYDASLIAAHLGVRYIWIDSICIVQDDGDDWKREAAKMADYYQNAWLTIAVTTTHQDGHLYGKTKVEDLPRVTRLPYRDKSGEHEGYFYAQCTGETETARDYKENVSQSKLLKRSWVYQEWLLSRRLITFSDSGVYLQCQTAKPKSVLGDLVEDRKDEWKESVGYVDIAFNKGIRLHEATQSTIWNKWITVVETYSGLEITKLEQDRLIALSGVAREFGAALQAAEEKGKGKRVANTPRYICGLWYGHIKGLLWEQFEEGPRRRVKGLPTWSWISMGSTKTGEDGREIRSGMSVHWPTKAKSREILPPGLIKSAQRDVKKREKKAAKKGVAPSLGFEYQCAFLRARAVRLGKRWKPRFHRVFDIDPNNEYDDANRFVMLNMRGRLLQVCIDGLFHNKEDWDIAARLTDHSPDVGRQMWRRVTTFGDQETIAGWASIEHPDYQTDDRCRLISLDGQVSAFIVTRIPKVECGFGSGNLTGYNVAFQVLFLRAKEINGHNQCYERIGVGRLFGKEVDYLFQDSEESEIWLV